MNRFQKERRPGEGRRSNNPIEVIYYADTTTTQKPQKINRTPAHPYPAGGGLYEVRR